MLNKNCMMATAAAFVTMFVLGYVIYEPILGGFMEANMGSATDVMKETPSYWQIVVGQLAGALLLVTVLSWKGSGNAAAGFKAGALVGALLALYYGFMNLGTTNITTMPAVLVDVAAMLVLLGAGGAAAGMVMQKDA